MHKERKQLEELFQKYSQGLITEEEKILIARWLAHLDVTEQLTPAQLQAKEDLSQHSLKEHFFPLQKPTAKVLRFGTYTRTIAASILVLFTTALILYVKDKEKLPVVQVAYKVVKTTTGQMKVITLTDGSEITLNNQSSLKYPTSFNGKTRTVFLSGEAFFKVAHNPAKPFKVHTEKLQIHVLGTSFDVRAYKDDKDVAVAVATGKVGVQSIAIKNKQTYTLLPGDQLTYNPKKEEFIKSAIDPLTANHWQEGVLIFKNQPLISITRELERHYKVKFQFVNKSLQNKELSLNVKNQRIAVVMKALSLSGSFNYKITGNDIKIW